MPSIFYYMGLCIKQYSKLPCCFYWDIFIIVRADNSKFFAILYYLVPVEFFVYKCFVHLLEPVFQDMMIACYKNSCPYLFICLFEVIEYKRDSKAVAYHGSIGTYSILVFVQNPKPALQ